MSFSDYIASVGPGVPITESRKNCALQIKLRFPQGWTFTVNQDNYRGFADLDNHVQSTQTAIYYFAGQVVQARLQTLFNGPYDDDYVISDTVPITSLVFSPCGSDATLVVNSAISVRKTSAGNQQGIMTTDTIDGSFRIIFNFEWHRC